MSEHPVGDPRWDATRHAIYNHADGHDGFTYRDGNIDPNNVYWGRDFREYMLPPLSGGLQEGEYKFYVNMTTELMFKNPKYPDIARCFWDYVPMKVFGYRFSPDGLRIYYEPSSKKAEMLLSLIDFFVSDKLMKV